MATVEWPIWYHAYTKQAQANLRFHAILMSVSDIYIYILPTLGNRSDRGTYYACIPKLQSERRCMWESTNYAPGPNFECNCSLRGRDRDQKLSVTEQNNTGLWLRDARGHLMLKVKSMLATNRTVSGYFLYSASAFIAIVSKHGERP